MSNLREAAKLALEALQRYVHVYNAYWEHGMDILQPIGEDAVSNLEAALAKPDDKAQRITPERKKDNGGPAFPAPDLGEQDFSQRGAYPGMTMRDYFAAKAMQVMIRNHYGSNMSDDKFDAMISRFSYEVADAMLKAREV